MLSVRVLKSGAVRGRVHFKVRAVSSVERASAEVTSSDRSCPCLKCDQRAVWSVRVQKCGALWSSER